MFSQQHQIHNDSNNKNVEIEFSAHDIFLE
jgi:hypothetical protein